GVLAGAAQGGGGPARGNPSRSGERYALPVRRPERHDEAAPLCGRYVAHGQAARAGEAGWGAIYRGAGLPRLQEVLRDGGRAEPCGGPERDGRSHASALVPEPAGCQENGGRTPSQRRAPARLSVSLAVAGELHYTMGAYLTGRHDERATTI